MTIIGPMSIVPESVCTGCGFKPDAASGVDTGKSPVPGDATLCGMCGHVMIFSDALSLREPTAEEAQILYSDPRVLVTQYAIRKLWEEKSKH